MKVTVYAKPQAKVNSIEEIDAGVYRVCVTESPDKGRANEAIVKLLANYRGVAPSLMKIIRGQSGRIKIIQIPDK